MSRTKTTSVAEAIMMLYGYSKKKFSNNRSYDMSIISTFYQKYIGDFLIIGLFCIVYFITRS